jgi:quinolinate synthase
MYLNKEQRIAEKINKLKKEKNAVILVHNYQRPEVYKVADFIGDSFELSKKATETDAEIIVFCGVDFMAETACILNPDKKVLLPAIQAKCPMAAMVNPYKLKLFKEKYPKAAVVSYVNTSAEIKAESDICCTSANVVKVVNSLSQRDVLFVPDKNLAAYVSRYTEKNIIPWDGFCYVHSKFSANLLKEAKNLCLDAKVIVHPECNPDVIDLADVVRSTSGIMDYVKKSTDRKFIIATEVGIIERLKIETPDKICYQAPPGGTCLQMKENNLELVLKSLEKEQYEVRVDEEIRVKAKRPLDRMLEVGR